MSQNQKKDLSITNRQRKNQIQHQDAEQNIKHKNNTTGNKKTNGSINNILRKTPPIPKNEVSLHASISAPAILRSRKTQQQQQKTQKEKDRAERDTLVLWRKPIQTTKYCSLEIITLLRTSSRRLLQQSALLFAIIVLSILLGIIYHIPGPHQIVIDIVRKNTWFFVYWIELGVLSSVGLGTGLHTFLLYLGPHVASVTLAAYECNSLNFPSPPYPDELRAGWSSSKTAEPLRPDEHAAIISVIRRNEEIEIAERQRVGRLVERVEKIKQHVSIDRGPNFCRLCGDAFGILRPGRIICEDCKKPVCTKCSIDINVRYFTTEKSREIWLCRVCSETREMWKKSGAWFFKGLPNYEVPSSTSSTPTRQVATTGLLRNAQSCTTTPKRNVRVKKLTIRLNDSSSSSNESDVDGIDIKNGECAAAATAVSTTDGTTANEAISPSRLQRDDSFRMRTFGSIRSFIDGGERKLSNSFFFNRQISKSDCSQPELDTLSTASTRRESNYTRRGSVSSSWSISGESSSGNSCSVTTSGGAPQHNVHCRDPLLGWLEVTISYRESMHSLDCTMVRARDLPPMDSAGLTDPFCKLNIVTAEGTTKYSRWQRSKTVHKTRNPEFNETVQFVGVEPEELGNSLLYVAIFDDDKFGHDFLGAAKVSLSTVHSTNQYRTSVPLSSEDQYSNEAELSQEWPNGKMLLSLRYNTKKRALVVNVKQCINLIPMDNNGSSDPFVKLQLKPDPHKNKKHKTNVKWHTLNPIFNEEFYFEASPHDLNKQTLIVTVWDKDIGKSNDFLGSLHIGYNSKGERLQQWLDCIRLPDAPHEKWHCLSNDEHSTHH